MPWAGAGMSALCVGCFVRILTHSYFAWFAGVNEVQDEVAVVEQAADQNVAARDDDGCKPRADDETGPTSDQGKGSTSMIDNVGKPRKRRLGFQSAEANSGPFQNMRPRSGGNQVFSPDFYEVRCAAQRPGSSGSAERPPFAGTPKRPASNGIAQKMGAGCVPKTRRTKRDPATVAKIVNLLHGDNAVAKAASQGSYYTKVCIHMCMCMQTRFAPACFLTPACLPACLHNFFLD